jgi:RNA polymerase sigma-70 factor (ECF subfamily)
MVALRLDPRLRGRVDASDVREILVLRHYEQMTNGDAAAALGLSHPAASMRYFRALERLQEILVTLPGEAREEGP